MSRDRSNAPVVSRRRFVQFLGAGTVLAAADATGWLGSVVSSLDDSTGVLTARLYRPTDQLRLGFEFLHLTHDAGGDRLVADGSNQTPLIRISFPRQHVSEQPTASGSTPPGAATAPIPHAAAGNSRLVFAVTPPIDLTVASLLDLASFALVATSAPGNPDDETSMVEIPADLRWSPAANVEAHADVAPFTHDGVTQLHRTKLVGPDGPFEFTPLFNASSVDGFTGRIPNSGDRTAIVNAAGAGPATAERLWLTPHGAWADLEGDWASTSWIQRVQSGRDQFAQVVSRGYLLPFGVPAVWTETATRLWVSDTDGETVSTMVSETHFAIAGDATADPVGSVTAFAGRLLPFRSVTAEQQDNVVAAKGTIIPTGGSSINTNNAWIVNHAGGTPLDGQPVSVAYSATDHIDQHVGFELPAIFVRAESFSNSTMWSRLSDFYASVAGADFRTPSIDAPMAWAEPIVEGAPTSSLFTRSLDIEFEPVDSVAAAAADELPIKPVARRGVVTSDSVGGDIPVVFSQRFIDHGLDSSQNPTLAYLDLVEPTAFAVGKEARAVMSPDTTAEEFNQTLGVGPIDDATTGQTWRPEDAFGEGAALLRGISLGDLVDVVPFDLAVAGIDIPTFESVQLPDRLEQSYTWCPENVKSVPALGFVTTASTELCVEVRSVIYFDGSGDPGAVVEFRVSNVELHVPPLLDLVVFDVDEISATQPVDGPADLTLDISDWRLGGDLAWLEKLFDLLTPAGSAFDLDVTRTEIVADLTIPVPKVGLGVLTIDQFDIGLTGTFPYVGDAPPTVAIGVGTRQAPVSLQIMQFGGAFRLGLSLDTQGLRELDVFAEVSARLVSIDITIAEAYCEVFISAEFKLLSDGSTKFTGKIGLEAHMSVCGVIGATLSIVGAVTYRSARERIKIKGTIHWSVTALFTFGGEVSIGTFEFELGEGSGPPTLAPVGGAGDSKSGSLGDVHTFGTWTDYVSKFAPA